MSDIYIPGIRSRFNSEQAIQDLMRLERVPRDRVANNVTRLEAEKSYWQEIGLRVTALRESARGLYSFQNPFNDRIVRSSDSSVITGTAVREAIEQERSFTIKQIAKADRFLSSPLEENYRVDAGTYTFTVGKHEISFAFRGGTLREFTDALNRRGQDKLQASLVAVRPGTRSLLIESRVTGAENRLGFSGDSEKLGMAIGMVEPSYDSRQYIDGTYETKAGARNSIPVFQGAATGSNMIMKFDISTAVRPTEAWIIPTPPSGPSIPSAGSISYGGIVIENEPSKVNLPTWTPPEPPRRVDEMGVISLSFTDGTSIQLPPITDSTAFNPYQIKLDELPPGKMISSINIINTNTHRDVTVRNIQIYDPESIGSVKPLNAVSTAQDAIIFMEGIEIERSTNTIDDLIPGLTLTLRAPTDKPVTINVEPDRERVKDAIISLVGNYNRLMTEINILTRTDPRIIDEITYLTKDEKDDYREKLGTFQTDSTLSSLRNMMMRTITSPYPTMLDRELALLSQIGVGSDVSRTGASTGYDPSRLRGYLEIDERALDAAIASKLPAIKELFGSDTTGDLLVDTGIAFNLESIARPFVETGGLISLKTRTVDNKIAQEQGRIVTMDRQLANKEAELKTQYAQMEAAYARMESMSQSMERFSQQNLYGNNR